MQRRYVALFIVLVASGGAYGFWPAPTVPLVHLQESADPVVESGKILKALREGKNIEVRSPVKSRGSGSSTKKRKTRKVVSFGHPPPSVKRRLDKRLRYSLSLTVANLDRVKKLVEAGDDSQLEELHKLSEEFALWSAMLDTLIHDRSLLTSAVISRDSIRDHYMPSSTVSEVKVDALTGLAIDKAEFARSKRPKEELLQFKRLVITYPIAKVDYPEIAFHRNEAKRVRRDSLVSKVITFNSLDRLQRKARYDYHLRLEAAMKKREETWEGKPMTGAREFMESKGIPPGIVVDPKRDHTAKVYGRR